MGADQQQVIITLSQAKQRSRVWIRIVTSNEKISGQLPIYVTLFKWRQEEMQRKSHSSRKQMFVVMNITLFSFPIFPNQYSLRCLYNLCNRKKKKTNKNQKTSQPKKKPQNKTPRSVTRPERRLNSIPLLCQCLISSVSTMYITNIYTSAYLGVPCQPKSVTTVSDYVFILN